MTEYIYLLQEREFIKTNENIYKLGKTTKDNLERIKQYPKGSKLLCYIACQDCHNCEKELLDIFNTNFKVRRDIGCEYFEGNYNLMIKFICKYIIYVNSLAEKQSNLETNLTTINTSCQ